MDGLFHVCVLEWLLLVPSSHVRIIKFKGANELESHRMCVKLLVRHVDLYKYDSKSLRFRIYCLLYPDSATLFFYSSEAIESTEEK